MHLIAIDVADRKDIENQHVKALSGKIDSAVKSWKQRHSGKSVRLNQYLNLIESVVAEDMLKMAVADMRSLVIRADHFLPKTDFCRSENGLTALEKVFSEANKDLARIYDYDAFSKRYASWGLGALAMRLKKYIRICPYCNAETIYSYKVKDGEGRNRNGRRRLKFRKSSFDHYFPKSRYPFLSISLYNLIPACTRCNSGLKGDIFKGLPNMAHPYLEDMHKHMKFRILPKTVKAFRCCSAEDISDILLMERKANTFSKGNVWSKMFGINDAYTQIYREDAADAMFKAISFSPKYVKSLETLLRNAGLPEGRLEKIVYGTKIDKNVINVSRLGKLIIDTVETYRE